MLTEKELEEIRRKMLELEEEPPVGNWQHIQAEVKPKTNWRPLWWLLPLLLLFMTGVITYQVMKIEPVHSIETGKQALSEQASPPIVQADKHGVLQEQSGLNKSLKSGNSPEMPGTRTPEVNQHSTVQQSLPILTTLPAVAATPIATGKGIMPEAQLVSPLPTKAPGITTLTDSTERAPQQVISKNILPKRVSFLTGRDREKAKVGMTKASEVNESTAGAGATASGEVAEPAKEEMLKENTLADTAAAEVEKSIEPVQKEKKKVAGRNEWTAGVYFAPRYAFRKFIPNASDDILITEVNSANQLDPERMGFEFGTNLSRKLAPGIFLDGGLSWMQLKENVTYRLTTGKIDSFNVSQADDGRVVMEPVYRMEERQLISSYAYGGLRLGATYYFMERGNSRLNVTVAGGANVLIKGRTRLHSNGVWTETVEFPSVENILEQSNYNLQLGVGYNASVLGNYEVTLMPTINYFLGSTFKEREPLGLKPYSLGLTMQLKRGFNR